MLVYALDDALAEFAPFALDEAATPAAVGAALRAREPARALALALALGDGAELRRVLAAVPPRELALVARTVPRAHVVPLLRALAERLARSVHLECVYPRSR